MKLESNYIKVAWPEIQDYMEHPNYPEDCYFDPSKGVWFIPEDWTDWNKNYWDDDPSIGDLEDALG